MKLTLDINISKKFANFISRSFLKFIICIFLFPIFSLSAQNFHEGILLGFTGSQFDGAEQKGYNKLGFTTGIFTHKDFDNFWGIQSELKFIMKGAANFTSIDNYTPSMISLYYIELPLTVTVKTSEKFAFESGLAFAYLLNATASSYGYPSADMTGYFNKTDYSFIAGVYYIFSERIKFNLKFSYSIKAVSYFPGYVTIWGTYNKQYNNLFDIAIDYKII